MECGINEDTRILLSSFDETIFLYQHRQDHGMVYFWDLGTDGVDSAVLPFPERTETLFYSPTAFDVSDKIAVLCFGSQAIRYQIEDSNWVVLTIHQIEPKEVIFHAGLDGQHLLLAGQRPDLGSKHRILKYTAPDSVAIQELFHPLVFLSTFSPNKYFDDHRGQLFFLDNAEFTVRAWNDSLETILDLSSHFDTSNARFIGSIQKRSVREQRALFMDVFGEHDFDLLTHLYMDDTSAHLLYFPALEPGKRLQRAYCRISLDGDLIHHISIKETDPSGLLGFKAVLIGDVLYWIRAEEGRIRIGSFPIS